MAKLKITTLICNIYPTKALFLLIWLESSSKILQRVFQTCPTDHFIVSQLGKQNKHATNNTKHTCKIDKGKIIQSNSYKCIFVGGCRQTLGKNKIFIRLKTCKKSTRVTMVRNITRQENRTNNYGECQGKRFGKGGGGVIGQLMLNRATFGRSKTPQLIKRRPASC